jgi:hypothetical protein
VTRIEWVRIVLGGLSVVFAVVGLAAGVRMLFARAEAARFAVAQPCGRGSLRDCRERQDVSVEWYAGDKAGPGLIVTFPDGETSTFRDAGWGEDHTNGAATAELWNGDATAFRSEDGRHYMIAPGNPIERYQVVRGVAVFLCVASPLLALAWFGLGRLRTF